MQGRLRVGAVHGRNLRFHLPGLAFEPVEVGLDLEHDRRGELVEHILAQPPLGLGQVLGQVDLLDPARDFREKRAHFVDHDLVIAPDIEARIPVVDEQLRLAPDRLGLVGQIAQLAPFVDQRERYHRGEAGIHQAHHHRLAQVGVLAPHAHTQLAQHLADLNDRVWIVDFHHQSFSLEIDNCAPHLLALRVAETDHRIDLRLGVHGIAPEKTEKRCRPPSSTMQH